LGISKDSWIQRFFGGNAVLAIVFLLAICAFLIKEAVFFFPDYHKSLQLFRKSGQEYVTLLEDQYKAQKSAYALVDQAYNIERAHVGAAELEKITAFATVRNAVLDFAEEAYDEWDDANDDLEDAQDEFDEAEEANKPSAQAALDAAKSLEQKLRAAWKADVSAAVLQQNAATEDIKDALRQMTPEEGISPFQVGLQDAVDAKVKDFAISRNALRDSVKPLEKLWLELRDVAASAKDKGVTLKTAAERKTAYLEAVKAATTAEAKAKAQEEADAVVLVAPDWNEEVAPLYAAIPRANEISKQLLQAIATAKQNLPDPASLTDPLAREKLTQASPELDQAKEIVTVRMTTLNDWRHDEKIGFLKSVTGFFLGADWVTNSSWQDFYGFLPLFTGSLLISIVALCIAVPFSVAAAIYTNQLASKGEATFIKPTIEFIQAIPSVVLGLFGILILGESLRNGAEFLGIPMQERLNVLNAGILLALMAVPTVFTLAEEAINNVPSAFRDASFALGATKFQTVLRVIVPTAISGIIAAVLLGFGRVIGETMVVLLVAGNKISIPDFSEGIGILTQPVHTMTGLIAQETGEVNQGSLHWRALFMVALVLFMISLTINYISQTLIRRYSLKG